MSSCLSVDPVPGEAGILRPALLRPGQEVQRAAADPGPHPETIGLRLPAASAHASATYTLFHPHPPTQGRRAVLGQPSPQHLQPEHLHVELPEAPASQGVHAEPGLGHLPALRHHGAPASASPAAEVNVIEILLPISDSLLQLFFPLHFREPVGLFM